jgi:hypothetical protein
MSGVVMNKHMDYFLAKVLNQWVAKHRPPADGRARLLQKAVTPTSQALNKFSLSWFADQPLFKPEILGLEWPRKLPGWLYISFQPGYGEFTVV